MEDVTTVTGVLETAGVPTGFIAAFVLLTVIVVVMFILMQRAGLIRRGVNGTDSHADLRALISTGFEDLKERISELRSDLKAHDEKDIVRFASLGDRVTRLESILEWDGTERRRRP